ncbi:P-loop containing nucleoside triphosphate hydrolase protein [Xylaria scruposa]|nr:P-loop containing nucleoside triphosphate hydrolase protein [Xylaria scruposa]
MALAKHDKCFALADRGEVDHTTLSSEHSITTGKMYLYVIKHERTEWIERIARIPVNGTLREPDAWVIELGGTASDIKNGPFVEAL